MKLSFSAADEAFRAEVAGWLAGLAAALVLVLALVVLRRNGPPNQQQRENQ